MGRPQATAPNPSWRPHTLGPVEREGAERQMAGRRGECITKDSSPGDLTLCEDSGPSDSLLVFLAVSSSPLSESWNNASAIC